MSKTFKKDSWFSEIIKRPIPIWRRYSGLPNNTCSYARALAFSLFVRMTALSLFGLVLFSLVFLDVITGYSIYHDIFHGGLAGGFFNLSADMLFEIYRNVGFSENLSTWFLVIISFVFLAQIGTIVVMGILLFCGVIVAVMLIINDRTEIFDKIKDKIKGTVHTLFYPSAPIPDEEIKKKEGRVCQFIEYK